MSEKEMSFEELFNESLKEKETKLEKTSTIKLMELFQKKNIVMMKMQIQKMMLK